VKKSSFLHQWDKNVVTIQNRTLLSHENHEIQSFVTTWLELEIILLSQITLAQKDKYPMISPICKIFYKIALTEVESRVVVTRR
jgi:hypothetical protein